MPLLLSPYFYLGFPAYSRLCHAALSPLSPPAEPRLAFVSDDKRLLFAASLLFPRFRLRPANKPASQTACNDNQTT